MQSLNDNENELMYIYEWVDGLPLSRSKKNISRDFCDGGLLAEIIKHYYPKLVDLHNYPPASSSNQKCYNWTTLNNKVLKKIGVNLTKQEINDAITCKSMAIEHILQKVYKVIDQKKGISVSNKKEEVVNNDALIKELNDKREIALKLKQEIQELELQLNKAQMKRDNFEREFNELNSQIQLGNNNIQE